MTLTVRGLCASIGRREILRDISFEVRPGEWLMLCGPNGAGKSTLLRCVSGALPFSGSVLLDGEDLRRMKPARRALLMGVMAQTHRTAYAYTVEEVVRLGRYARRGPLGGADEGAEAALGEALRLTGLTGLRRRSVLSLSGGEYQRCMLAQALCQQPALLLLDEPANHLDLSYQQQLYSLVDAWRREEGRAVVTVEHSLTAARRWGTHALLLREGRQLAFGPVREALEDSLLTRTWGMDVAGWMREEAKVWAPAADVPEPDRPAE